MLVTVSDFYFGVALFSAKDKTEKKLFGFSFLKLVNEYGNTVRDGPHEMYVYKVSPVRTSSTPRHIIPSDE